MKCIGLQCVLFVLVTVVLSQEGGVYRITFEDDPDVDDEVHYESPLQQEMSKFISPIQVTRSRRFPRWRQEVIEQHKSSGSRARRDLIIRCCGLRTCFPTQTRRRKAKVGNKAYAKLTWEGVSISCPNCPKGWHSKLKWQGATKGIPIECPGCPEDWETMLNVDAADTTVSDEEVTDSEEETTDAEEEEDKSTTTSTTSTSTSTSTTKNSNATTVTTVSAAATNSAAAALVSATTVPTTATAAAAAAAASTAATTAATASTATTATTATVTTKTTAAANAGNNILGSVNGILNNLPGGLGGIFGG